MSQSVLLLCSTGAFSRYPDYTGYEAVQKYGPLLDVDGFEVMFYPGWYTALGQADPAARERGVQQLTENFQLAQIIGCKLVVLHLWNWPELDDNLAHNLAVLNQCYDIAAQYNLELALETIPGRHFDPLTNIQRALVRDPRSRFALDTEFLYNYDQLETIFSTPWLWSPSRVHHVHIKDSLGQPFIDGQRKYLHPGEGEIDFTQFFGGLQQHGFTGHISLEAPAITLNGEVHIPQLQASLDFIRQFLW
jgi:sugar phosphate isomerase/epimerase